MVSKKTILLLLALHGHILGFAQADCNYIFSGGVVDELNQPLIGASIFNITQQAGQPSDSAGNFKFENLCAGRYRIRVQYLGYQDQEFNLSIKGNVDRVIRLLPIVTELNEVVIQHHDASHTEHAQNYVQLNEQQLFRTGGKGLGQSLKEVSGVNSIQTGPGIFKPVIHGVHSQRILTLNYGIRQEGQQWGAEHAPEIDPFIASNIVVIKDASAIKYGADALGGVIVVNPPALPERAQLGGMLQTILQSNGRSGTVSGMLEGGIKKHSGWGWRVQGTGKKAGDFNTRDYLLNNTGLNELNFSASAGYHQENKGFDVFFSRFQTEIGIFKGSSIGNLDDLIVAMESPVPLYTTNFGYEISEPRQEVSHNLLKLNGHIATKSGEWRLQYGFQNNSRKEFVIRIGEDSKTPSINLELNTHTLDAEWETLHSDKRTIAIGVNGTLQENNNIYGTMRRPFIPDFNSIGAGLYGVTKLYLKKWTINLGARYDYRYNDVRGYDYKNSLYHTDFGFGNVSATAGASVQLEKNKILSFNLSSAWRPPHVSELYSLGRHQSVASVEYGLLLNDINNEVMPFSDVNFGTEQAFKFVTTYKHEWKDFTFMVGPYANYIFNYIFLRPEGISVDLTGAAPYFRYRQTDALFLGVDLEGSWQAGKYLQVIPKASLLRASDERSDNFFVFIPSNRYDVTLRYERPTLSAFRNFYLESKCQYVAKQNRAPRVIAPRQFKDAFEQDIDLFETDKSSFDFMAAPDGYFLLNFSAGFSIKNKKTQYDFRIASENTLNQKYREYTNRFRYYADDLGRNIILSFKCIF